MKWREIVAQNLINNQGLVNIYRLSHIELLINNHACTTSSRDARGLASPGQNSGEDNKKANRKEIDAESSFSSSLPLPNQKTPRQAAPLVDTVQDGASMYGKSTVGAF